MQNAHQLEEPSKIDFKWGVKIPMRDGIQLNATIYRPKTDQPVPVIFTLTPYTGDTYHPRATYFAQHGYVFALVDCRGRGNSEGKFNPNIQEANDGADLVEWLARQPWCDGQVTMWGGSYAGTNQWLTLREFPPQLKTIVPASAAHMAVDFPILGNIMRHYIMQWLTLTSGVTANMNLWEQRSAFWIERFQELYQNHRAHSTLDEIVGNDTTVFQTWLQHPHPDAYWDQMALTEQQYDQINVPILTIAGYYDNAQPGTLEYYRRHMRSNSGAKDQHYLVIGPWDHAGTRTPNREVGGLKFGEAALVDLNQLHKAWYDWTMKAGEPPAFLKKRVAYYVMGEEAWKYADSVESIVSETRQLYLASNGEANDVFHSGSLTEEAVTDAPPDQFTYDPLDTRPGELEREPIKNLYTDQTFDLNLFGNGLVYHSAPFDEATEITGRVKLVAWLELNVPDTDFRVELSEVLANGDVIRLTSDQLRARYRQSLREEKLVVPGEINPYTFDGFRFFSRRIARLSRLRLVIACINSIYFPKNYNGGGEVAKETGKDAKTALITLYHDADHPSYLELPIARYETI